MSLIAYRYTALDDNGNRSRGTVRAGSEQEAYGKLSIEGLTPLELEVIRAGEPVFSFQRVTQADIVNFTRELAVLVEARIPLDRGLVSIAEHEPKRALADMVRDVATLIESGMSITQALAKYRSVFGDVYIETIAAAEKTGNLQEVTSHLAEMLDKQAESHRQVRRALTYPVIVIGMVFAALGVIVGFVVPKFAATFASSGARLPLATRVVQAVGESFQQHWYAYAGLIAGAMIALVLAWRNPSGRAALEVFLTRIPYIGRIVICTTAARFARVMSIGLTSGLDVIDSIQVAGRASGRPVFTADCDTMASRLREGERLADVVQGTRYVPGFARRMIGAGKDSKEVARACDIVARHYDREAGHLTKNIGTVIEPLLTVALAAIVLVVALAVFLPMWQMARISR